jgi:hypothetical protein
MRRADSMQAVIETKQDGSVEIELDSEAARAMVAGILFASRFHEGIVPLAGMLKEGLGKEKGQRMRRALCQ